MRVLHVYAGNLYGGVEAMLATFARCRDLAPEMEPAFALAFEGRLSRELREAGIPAEVVGGARLSRPWTVWRARRRFAQVLRSQSPDVAVFHSAWSHGIFAPAARRMGIPVAFWLHDALSGAAPERLARRTPPDLAICTSEFVRGTLPRLFPHAGGHVVYPAVPAPPDLTAGRAAVRAGLATDPASVVIVQASRMDPMKGHGVLLEALGSLKDAGGWTCWIAGGAARPHERQHLGQMRAQAGRLGIADRIRWLGERADVPALLAAADALCQPSLGPEAFGISCVEAMQARLPVAASAVGGTREVVDATTGLLVPPGEPGALADALGRLIRDPALRRTFGDAGPARAAALCDPARQLGRTAALLAGIAGPPSPSRRP